MKSLLTNNIKKFGSDLRYVKKNYMSWKHIINLKNRGHEIGSHSHNHYGDRKDYEKSLKILKKKIRKKLTLFLIQTAIKSYLIMI